MPVARRLSCARALSRRRLVWWHAGTSVLGRRFWQLAAAAALLSWSPAWVDVEPLVRGYGFHQRIDGLRLRWGSARGEGGHRRGAGVEACVPRRRGVVAALRVMAERGLGVRHPHELPRAPPTSGAWHVADRVCGGNENPPAGLLPPNSGSGTALRLVMLLLQKFLVLPQGYLRRA
ncbi:hypothetical protein GOEFS_017_00795 [Gordonia effusa NBRC 100432]|uniref:Uncharacterized protein n=1 Tax=Gordonia effusa NBRC 100432 TaxID=1077974 RepID=H0QVW3_9ACTN|nr:hypothetical protein GOEFS_017_00795 [Gordonia effusa NBRC 100432]